MCYICEERGTVGANYKRAQKTIAAALRVWRRKNCDQWRQMPSHGCYASCEASRGNIAIAWDKRPTKAKVWTAKDFESYQRRMRYSPLPGGIPNGVGQRYANLLD